MHAIAPVVECHDRHVHERAGKCGEQCHSPRKSRVGVERKTGNREEERIDRASNASGFDECDERRVVGVDLDAHDNLFSTSTIRNRRHSSTNHLGNQMKF